MFFSLWMIIELILTTSKKDIVFVWVELSVTLFIEKCKKVLVWVARIVNAALLAFIKDKHKGANVAENRQLYTLFQKPLLSFAVGHFSMINVFDGFNFLNFSFSHWYEFTKCLLRALQFKCSKIFGAEYML